MADDPTLTVEERKVRALESIAAALLKLANPPMMVTADSFTDTDLAMMKRGPGQITYVDRFGRPTPQPDRTA